METGPVPVGPVAPKSGDYPERRLVTGDVVVVVDQTRQERTCSTIKGQERAAGSAHV